VFRVDRMPKPLPNHWIVGAVSACGDGAYGWIAHRPSTLRRTKRDRSGAPAAGLEFDAGTWFLLGRRTGTMAAARAPIYVVAG